MAIKSKTSKGGRDVGRRTALKTLGSAAAIVVGASATGHWNRSFAQSKKVVRVWTTQVAPDQLKGYDYYKETFEAAHPGIEIEWEHVSDDDGSKPRTRGSRSNGSTSRMTTGGRNCSRPTPAAIRPRSSPT